MSENMKLGLFTDDKLLYRKIEITADVTDLHEDLNNLQDWKKTVKDGNSGPENTR